MIDEHIALANIPTELLQRGQWVGWRWARRNGKQTKVPINPHTGSNGDVSAQKTWGTFNDALASRDRYRVAGVGFVFTTHDPYVGIDLDSCAELGFDVLAPWAAEILDRFETYAERSPSGKGIKLFCKGALPTEKTGTRRPFQSGAVEMYQSGRFFTVTGQIWPGAPTTISNCQPQIDELWTRICPKRAARDNSSGHTLRPATEIPCADDNAILTKARTAKNGVKFSQLWDGKFDGFASQSEADISLCNLLAFWCGPNPERIDLLFRQSGLMRDKWER
jgi:primase-polymerase (primpol)-like protein